MSEFLSPSRPQPRRRPLRNSWLLLLAGLPALFAASAVQAAAPGESCHLPGHDKPLRCLSVSVPRDYQDPAAGELVLHVTVAPAFREHAKADPLFVLAGGPGQSGSSIVYLLEAAFQRIRATRDIVFIDQRGTGKSGRLICDSLMRTETTDPAQLEQLMRDCFQSLKVNFAHYNTDASVQDLERVREVLGAAQVNVWGGSYGTRYGQAYARAYPERVRSLILDGVAAPDQNIGLIGGDTGRAFAQLKQQCADDAACSKAFPDFAAQLDALIARSETGTDSIRFAHPVTGADTQWPLLKDGFAEQVRTMLYAPQTAVRLPWLIAQAHAGNWGPFAAVAVNNQSWAQDTMAVGMTLAVLCAEDIAHVTPEQALAESPLSFLGNSWATRFQRWCGMVNVPKRERPSTAKLDVPTLLLSGDRDPVTPPSRAEQAMQFLGKAQHLIAKNAGHGVSHLGCAPKLLRAFVDDPAQTLDGKCLDELTPSPFPVSAAGATP